ncbi:hypothetical protein VP01_3675g2 [Puccinia sorghi]|uniref:Reverse transcriptase Ty1/copia-type domain-containing protein n=1 Tax=Puccinia sorghi TaxID=27349 RepID=A0A0L6UV52_9BASI|nr:hypothetical protein VP01_3675g2 [Puccinia sorghi]
MGKLLGFNEELNSYRILVNNGRIVDTKNVTFLNFKLPPVSSDNLDDLLILEERTTPVQELKTKEAKLDFNVKIEEPEEDFELDEEDYSSSGEEETQNEDVEVAESLIPQVVEPVGRILCDRTLQVKPVKYSYHSEDPHCYEKAIKSDNSEAWVAAIDSELDNIEQHQVWDDHFDTPNRFLNTTWVFRTKPATASLSEKAKARLCIQGFLQTPGKDFFDTFAPTGKFPSLLTLLVLAIDLQMPIR